MSSDAPLQALLDALGDTAALADDQSRSTPPQAFVSEDFHDLEVDRIFNHEWHCVGREDEFAEPGAYRTLTIGRDPVIVVRDGESGLRAMSNVCRHRMMTLVHGEGRLGHRITCPYHAWSYASDGRLTGATHVADDFDMASCRLPQFQVEVWQGWVYVNLDPTAPPLGPRLAGLGERYDRHHMARYRSLFRVDVDPGTWPEGETGACRAKELREIFDRINEEDKPIVAAVARNAQASAATPGRLSAKERTIRDFQRYLARRLRDPRAVPV